MEALLRINNVAMPTPSGIEVTYQDYDSNDSNRNANGELIRERVRASVRRLDVTWKILNAQEMSLILRSLDPVFFTVRFFDPKSASFQNATMYVGDRKPTFYTLRDDEILYQDFTIALVEK